MLEKQMWMKYPAELLLEWKQAKDEGKEVDYLKDICQQVSLKADARDYSDLAKEIRNKLLNSPVESNYPYVEPSSLEDIIDQKPSRRHTLINSLTDDQLKNKLAGAWIGRISGCLLGKPVEGFKRERLNTLLTLTNNYPMHKYILEADLNSEIKEKIDYTSLKLWQKCWADTIGGIAPIDDDTNYTVFGLKLIKEYGKDFRPNDVLEAWLSWIPMFATCTAERIAYRNAAMGMYAPQTAIYNNPYREWIGAQIRGDFFGYINPGNAEKSSEMAWRDASISHVKNGIYGEMFIAAMIAAAAVCDDIITIIEVGLDEIPQNSRLRRDIELVLEWYNENLSETQVIDRIHQTYDENDQHGWCHTNSNAMVIVMALLYGKKDFGKSICLSVQAAFDTDCNGASVGSIVGSLVGGDAIPEYWYKIYNQKLATSISGYNEVTVEQLVKETMEVIKL